MLIDDWTFSFTWKIFPFLARRIFGGSDHLPLGYGLTANENFGAWKIMQQVEGINHMNFDST